MSTIADRFNSIRPLGEFAFQFLKKCQKRKDIVLVSNEVINKLLTYYSKERVSKVFSSFQDIIVKIEQTKKQSAEAYSLLKKI